MRRNAAGEQPIRRTKADERWLELLNPSCRAVSSNSPTDTGIAGVDIYRFDSDGKAVEHWDTLQLVGDPTNSAPWIAPNIPRANLQGMF